MRTLNNFFLATVVLLFIFHLDLSAQGAKKSINWFSLKLQIEKDVRPDTITLVYWIDYVSPNLQNNEIDLISSNGIFNVHLPMEGSTAFYFTLNRKGKNVLPNVSSINPLIGVSGKEVNCTLKEDGLPFFTGKGAPYYDCQMAIRFAASKLINTWQLIPRADFDSKSFLRYYKGQMAINETMLSVQLAILEGYKTQFSPYLYKKLLTDIYGKTYFDIAETHRTFLGEIPLKTNSDSLQAIFIDRLNQWYQDKRLVMASGVPDSLKAGSKDYARFLIADERTRSANSKTVYNSLKTKFTSVLRDKAIALYLTENYNRNLVNPDSILDDAILFIKTPAYLETVRDIKTRFSIGKHAFNFNLPNAMGNLVKLSDFIGKTIVLDFWFTGCTACAQLYREVLKPVEEIYKEDPDIVFISISTDRNKAVWLKSINEGKYTSLNAVNLFTNGLGSDHKIIKAYNAYASPTLVLIDRVGNIKSVSMDKLGKVTSLINMIKEK
jgi:peroxiredoxin